MKSLIHECSRIWKLNQYSGPATLPVLREHDLIKHTNLIIKSFSPRFHSGKSHTHERPVSKQPLVAYRLQFISGQPVLCTLCLPALPPFGKARCDRTFRLLNELPPYYKITLTRDFKRFLISERTFIW